MFKRTIEMKVVKSPKPHIETEVSNIKLSEHIVNAMTRKNIFDAAKLIGVGYAGKKLVDTSSTVALLIAQSKLK